MEKFRHIDTWVFDLDNTLYNAETHVFPEVTERMTAFVSQLLGLPEERAREVRTAYFRRYGTTLRGLMTEHGIDPHAFLSYVHDIDLSSVPRCDITDSHLSLLPGRRIVFTNSPARFAADMLSQLGIDAHFAGVFAIEDADYWPKPHAETYSAFLRKFGVDPARACMVEDMAVNLKPAHDLGMTTVWLHGESHAPSDPHPDHVHHKAARLPEWLQRTAGRKT